MTPFLRAIIAMGFAFCFEAFAQQYGLDARAPFGAFLNSNLPPAAPMNSGGYTLISAFPHLNFTDPVGLVAAPRSNRLYVYNRQGIIWSFNNDPNTTNQTVFLDLHAHTQGYGDCGLLGLAFHPEFGLAGSTNRGYFYVWRNFITNPVTSFPPLTTPTFDRLSRFAVPDGSQVADPNSEMIMINQYDRHVWHNGGSLFFGDDGFLYFSNGDEGGIDDEYGQAQKMDSGLFSGIFRIDVNNDPNKSHVIRRQPISGGGSAGLPPSYSTNYYIPNDNPAPIGYLEEFWAIGVRSPHRMTMDPVTKKIWLGDVGQDTREEIDIIERGGNYEWDYREGFVAGPHSKPSQYIGTERDPIYDYPHTNGNSCVIGGYVYRGNQFPELYGKYIFGDNTSGRIWVMTYDFSNPPAVADVCTLPAGSSDYTGLSGFGVDQTNELYICRMGQPGDILKLARTATINPAPVLLSQTGAFTNLSTLAPMSGLIPYDVNAPLWSDGAAKTRWIGVPNDGSPYGTNEQINFAPTGEWSFPMGTVFVKHFALLTNETNPNSLRRLETRFLVRDTNQAVYGLTYKWRADGSDADLLESNLTEAITIQTAAGTRTQNWYYPSRQDCVTCHNGNANFILGPKTRQLNGSFTYPATGRSDNQLRTWNHLGLFNPALNETNIPSYAQLVPLTNNAAPLVDRVRSYIDANCALCHRPGGTPALFDARFDTPLLNQGIVNGAVANTLGISGAKVICPGSLSQSVMRVRLNTVGANQMPPLAKNVVDTNAVAVLDAWISSLTNAPRLSLGRDGSGRFLKCAGEEGMIYSLESATNLPSTWTQIATVTNRGVRYITSDINNTRQQFYRLKE